MTDYDELQLEPQVIRDQLRRCPACGKLSILTNTILKSWRGQTVCLCVCPYCGWSRVMD